MTWQNGMFQLFSLHKLYRISFPEKNFAFSDDSKFGKKMLEKMGWKPGCGLGKYEQGITENLRPNANVSTRGSFFSIAIYL